MGLKAVNNDDNTCQYGVSRMLVRILQEIKRSAPKCKRDRRLQRGRLCGVHCGATCTIPAARLLGIERGRQWQLDNRGYRQEKAPY
jgi:hypothetical protein